MFVNGKWKDLEDMTAKERREHSIRQIINTSIEDAQSSIAGASQAVLIDALAREKAGSNRSSLIKKIKARLRKLAKVPA